MDINKKIEEIRQKPEHIRIRYVWGMVAISMLFIIIIWLFSIDDLLKESKIQVNSQQFPDIKENIDQIKSIQSAAPSIKEMIPEGEGIQNEEGLIEENLTEENEKQESLPALPIE